MNGEPIPPLTLGSSDVEPGTMPNCRVRCVEWRDRLHFSRFHFRSGSPWRAPPPDRRPWRPASVRHAPQPHRTRQGRRQVDERTGRQPGQGTQRQRHGRRQQSAAASTPAAQDTFRQVLRRRPWRAGRIQQESSPASPTRNWFAASALPPWSITSDSEKSLTYRGNDGTFQVKVQGGKVTSIAKPKP